MASIGLVSCTFVKGTIPLLKMRVETWQVPGVDGYGAQLVGYGNAEFSVRAIGYGMFSVINSWAASLESLQGTVVTIVDDWGATSPYCLITRVHTPEFRAAWGTHGDCRGEVRIEGVRVY